MISYINEQKDVHYVICEDFEGKRRRHANSGCFTRLENALKQLEAFKKVYDHEIKSPEIAAWYKKHRVSAPYLAMIKITKMRKIPPCSED